MSRGGREQANDLHESEARTILNAGLALMPVQRVARAGWSPTKSLGTTYGRNAAAHVREIGFPPGVNVWLDLEGIKSSSSQCFEIAIRQLDDKALAPAPFPLIALDAARQGSKSYRPLSLNLTFARSSTFLNRIS